MPKFHVEITKRCIVEIDADNKKDALQSARDRDYDGTLQFDEAIDAIPIAFGGKTLEQWRRALENEHDCCVYEVEDMPGHFGYTGSEADHFESEDEALVAALIEHGVLPSDMSEPEESAEEDVSPSM